MRGHMPMLKPTAALRESLMGVAPCFKYDQKGSVTCSQARVNDNTADDSIRDQPQPVTWAAGSLPSS